MKKKSTKNEDECINQELIKATLDDIITGKDGLQSVLDDYVKYESLTINTCKLKGAQYHNFDYIEKGWVNNINKQVNLTLNLAKEEHGRQTLETYTTLAESLSNLYNMIQELVKMNYYQTIPLNDRHLITPNMVNARKLYTIITGSELDNEKE